MQGLKFCAILRNPFVGVISLQARTDIFPEANIALPPHLSADKDWQCGLSESGHVP
jgi:hypothetical protein